MNNEIAKMNKLWANLVMDKKAPTSFPLMNFNEIVSEVFAVGPFYYYIVDFYDLSISHISKGFKEAHGVDSDEIKSVNDILAFIHPDDIIIVINAEDRASRYIKNTIGIDKMKEYKFSYNFRFKTATGDYQLFNHQSLILTTDQNGNFGKSLNIHTNVNHLTTVNNQKLSLIGLGDNPSYLNMDIFPAKDCRIAEPIPVNRFSKRELQIIKLIANGHNTSEIAEQLYISMFTVKTHRKNILSKSGCKNAADLVARGISEGWI